MNRYFILLSLSLIWSTGYADDYSLVNTSCVVDHYGYKGTIIAPGISEPSGKIKKLECNGKVIEIKNNEMVNGLIDTKEYGKVKVHFSSNIVTVGAGDFISVPPGKTIEWDVRDIYVKSSVSKKFSSKYGSKK